MARHKLPQTVYFDARQDEALRRIRERTGIPMAVLIRDALDLAIARWDDDTEDRFGEAEQEVDVARAKAEESHTHMHPAYVELDLVLTRAREVQLERDLARAQVERYRQRVARAQRLLSQPLGDLDEISEA